MKKFSRLLGVLVILLSFSSKAIYIAEEEESAQSSWVTLEYIWSSLSSLFYFDGLIDFGPGVFPDLRSLYSIRTEPYSAEEYEKLGLRE